MSFNRRDSENYGGSIEQTFDTTVGRTKTITLNLIEENTGDGNHTFQIDLIDANGQVIATTTATVTNDSTLQV